MTDLYDLNDTMRWLIDTGHAEALATEVGRAASEELTTALHVLSAVQMLQSYGADSYSVVDNYLDKDKDAALKLTKYIAAHHPALASHAEPLPTIGGAE